MSDAELRIDDYQLTGCIATGTSSQVWEVRDGGGQVYAMKLLLPDAMKNPDQINVLKHEAKVGQSLDHPNFVRTHKFVKTKAHCYMLMELFKSPSLKVMLQADAIAAQGRFGRLVDQLCQALGYMHDKGWLHHDLKPENILFSKSSEMKLIDFSLSMRRQGGLGKVFAGKVKIVQGTRTYIAPETIKKQYPTVASDIYSLGVTLFEVLAGQPPFVGSSPNDLLQRHLAAKPPAPSAFNENVTPEADKVILRLLSKKPDHRPKDMAEVASEFRSLKVFKKDPFELALEDEAKLKAAGLGLDAKSRLDSRADAARTAAGIAAPARPEPRKPSAAVLAEAAKRAGGKPGYPPQQPYPSGQPGGPPGYQPAPGWAGYGQPDYPQGYWPQYVPQQADPQSAQSYYGQQGPPPQYADAYPAHQAESQPIQPTPVAPAALPPTSAPPHPTATSGAVRLDAAPAQGPAATGSQAPPIGQGKSRGPFERHPTQQNIDADDLPEMDELPEVL